METKEEVKRDFDTVKKILEKRGYDVENLMKDIEVAKDKLKEHEHEIRKMINSTYAIYRTEIE